MSKAMDVITDRLGFETQVSSKNQNKIFGEEKIRELHPLHLE